jgi:hypothetical protein
MGDPIPFGLSPREAWFSHVPAIPYRRHIRQGDPPRAAGTASIGAQVESILGYADAAFIDDPQLWASRIHPDDLGRVLAAWRQTGEVGDRYHLTYRMIARNGRVVQVLDDAGVAEDPVTGVRSWVRRRRRDDRSGGRPGYAGGRGEVPPAGRADPGGHLHRRGARGRPDGPLPRLHQPADRSTTSSATRPRSGLPIPTSGTTSRTPRTSRRRRPERAAPS